MNRFLSALVLISACCLLSGVVGAQEVAGDSASDQGATSTVGEKASDIVAETQKSVDRLAEEVNQDVRAQQASTSILSPIYRLAEYMSFPAFHWLAFAIMITGVVSFALQLVLAKLVLLAKSSFSLSEVLSDALGLVISLIGLVLTTQAATENSSFTENSFAVLSATAVGVIAGLIFYYWGQRQEVEAVKGRTKTKSPSQNP